MGAAQKAAHNWGEGGMEEVKQAPAQQPQQPAAAQGGGAGAAGGPGGAIPAATTSVKVHAPPGGASSITF